MVTTKNLEAVTEKIKATTWSPARKFSLRVTVVYIIQLCIPLSLGYYQRIFPAGSGSSGRNWQAVSRFTGFHLPRYVDIGTDIMGTVQLYQPGGSPGDCIGHSGFMDRLRPQGNRSKPGLQQIVLLVDCDIALYRGTGHHCLGL
jgi:hypothetical protein